MKVHLAHQLGETEAAKTAVADKAAALALVASESIERRSSVMQFNDFIPEKVCVLVRLLPCKARPQPSGGQRSVYHIRTLIADHVPLLCSYIVY